MRQWENNVRTVINQNHFARMYRSQQVSEITENTESSEEECNLIQTFDSCKEFEVMVIEQKDNQIEMINRYIKEKVRENSGSNGVNKLETKKIDIRKDSTSGRMESLKALIRNDNQIINMTVDTGSPISFIIWSGETDFRLVRENTVHPGRKIELASTIRGL